MDVEDVERLLNEIGSLKENEIKNVEVKCQRENNNQTHEENYNGDAPEFHKLNIIRSNDRPIRILYQD